MAGVSFTVHTEGLDALKDKMERGVSRVEHTLAVQVQSDTSPYVPMKTGALDNSTQVEGNRIIYRGPYARMLYAGKVMVDAKTGKGPMRIVDKDGNEYIRFHKGARLRATSRDLNFSTAAHPKAQSHWFEASKRDNLEKWEETTKEAQMRELKR